MSAAEILVNVASRVAARTRQAGPRSGWVCLRTHLHNSCLRLRERVSRTPRVACPCCGWEGRSFRAVDAATRVVPDIECPGCLAHCRHRMFEVLASRRDLEFLRPGARVLHCAPEWQVRRILEARPGVFTVSSDIDRAQLAHGLKPRVLSNLYAMTFRDDTFDAIFLFHIMEHIPDERRALAELKRILKPGGVVLVMVPFNPFIHVTEEWGRPRPDFYDHVRDYAQDDFIEHLHGFEVTPILPESVLSADERARYKIPHNEVVYFCRKPA